MKTTRVRSVARPALLAVIAALVFPLRTSVPAGATTAAKTGAAVDTAAAPRYPRFDAPSSDVFLARLSRRDGAYHIDAPRNITRRTGYDNQPAFLPGGAALLYASIDTAGQADVYRYTIATHESRGLTRTPESEFSPTVIPALDAFSTVRVEADGSQRLWRFALDGTHPARILSRVDSIGYHAWLGQNTLALFVLGDPFTLRIADVEHDADRIVASGIGRAVVAAGPARVLFIKTAGDQAWISRYSTASSRTERLFEPLEGAEDFAWAPDGTLFMASGPRIYERAVGGGNTWHPIADFTEVSVDNIKRIAVDVESGLIAFVAGRSESQ